MNMLEKLCEALPEFIPALIAIVVVVVGLCVANWFLLHRNRP